MIDAQVAKRGKTVASRKLRNSAKKFDGMVIDYRQMGYVTEVKDQVRLALKAVTDAPMWGWSQILVSKCLFAGLLWLLLGLQHYRSH